VGFGCIHFRVQGLGFRVLVLGVRGGVWGWGVGFGCIHLIGCADGSYFVDCLGVGFQIHGCVYL